MRTELITLAQAARWCSGTVAAEYADRAFFGAHIDSRKLRQGELFICICAERDGHVYARAAIERGAAAVLASKPLDADIPAIYVPDTLLALQQIARAYRESLSCKVIGITGSVGKTTTKEMLAAVLGTRYETLKTEKNFNNALGLPLMLLRLRSTTEYAVLEMGMNHFGELSCLTAIAQPDIALITNIGTMHIENLHSREGILQAKLELLEGLRPGGRVLLNGDDDLLSGVAAQYHALIFGSGEACDIRASEVQTTPEQTCFTATAFGETFPLVLPVPGVHHVTDALAAVGVGLLCGVTPAQIQTALAAFENTAQRQRRMEHLGLHIIDDSYNAGPESMRAALSVLSTLPGRKIAVLGGMLELGEFAEKAHEEIGAFAATHTQMLFAYGKNSAAYVRGARQAGMEYAQDFPTHDALYHALIAVLQPGDALLFKGSHGMHMERVLDLLLHEVDLNGGTMSHG